MGGHVFVVRGDLTKLRCDAWLLPCDAGVGVTADWRQSLHDDIRTEVSDYYYRRKDLPPGWGDFSVRVAPVESAVDSGSPQPFLVNVGAWHGMEPDWYLEGVRQFFDAACASIQTRTPITKRAKPLLALPLVGTGAGGASGIKGDIIQHLVRLTLHEAASRDVDIVIVTQREDAFHAVQHARRSILSEPQFAHDNDHGLSQYLLDHCAALAEHAVADRLVLFLGAGVSMGAGLPGWDELLAVLARETSFSEQEQKALSKLTALDRARIIRSRLESSGKSPSESLARALTAPHYSLAHGLLASLTVSEVVTTNYDTLFETASEAAGVALATLPYESIVGCDRWLLKLHGSIGHRPDDIVLTREDYLRYDDRRAALAGIVQALLITRHMLFVGFSLTDDNFHRIVDDVRKALRGLDGQDSRPERFGAALLLHADPLQEELWKDDLHLVSMSGDPANHASTAETTRTLEIFLDRLLTLASRGHVPLLDPAYAGMLSPEEEELSHLLAALTAGATEDIRQSPHWKPIADLLRRFGEHSGVD